MKRKPLALFIAAAVHGLVIDTRLPLGMEVKQDTPAFTSGILDSYTAVMGFSLRQLKTAATKCVRVRRSSDNGETDIGFAYNVALGNYWIDESAVIAHGAGAAVSITRIYDQSGGTGAGQYIQYPSAVSQPIIVNGGVWVGTKINGRYAIPPMADVGVATGTSSLLACVNGLYTGGAIIAACVAESPYQPWASNLFAFVGNANTRYRFTVNNPAPGKIGVSACADNSSAVTARNSAGDVWRYTAAQITAVVNTTAATQYARKDGVQTHSGASFAGAYANTNATAFHFNRRISGLDEWVYAQTGELIVLLGTSNITNIPAIEADQKLAWGTP